MVAMIATFAAMEFLPPQAVKIDDRFWSPKYRIWRERTIADVFDKFDRTGWFGNFDRVAAGESGSGNHAGREFADGLCYEAIRGASDYLAMWPSEELDRRLDGYIARIAAAQAADPDGYLNTFTQLQQPGHRWGENGGCMLFQHELYNPGMLVEAGVHHYLATGKTTLLAVATRYANLLCDTIGPAPKHNRVPTHSGPEEPLLKLARLYRDDPALAGRMSARPDSYVELVEFWMDSRGRHCGLPKWDGNLWKTIEWIGAHAAELYDPDDPQKRPNWGDYAMDDVPLDEYRSIEGHAVRATLLATGIATLARETGSERYRKIGERLWNSMVGRKMYITGGVGALADMERFGPDYFLPPAAYLETCAAVGSAFFSARMAELSADGRYVDELERVLYNAMLTAVGESGTEYTYENPLESSDHRRWAWHDCPCCPPMFLKLTGAMPGYIYSSSADTAFVNLYISSKAQIPLSCGKIAIETETGYPERGDVAVRIGTAGRFALKLRIPGWALGRENPFGLYVSEAPGPVEIKVNGEPFAFETADGYAAIVREWNEGDEVALSLPVGERTVRASPLVKDVAGKTARARGPVVYALENGACVPYYSVANGDSGAKCSFSVWNSAPVEVEAKGGGKEFLVFSANGVKEKFAISAPVFTLDGRRVSMEADLAASGEPVRLANGVDEYAYEGKVKALDGAGIRVIVRVAPDSPVVRFRYELTADEGKSFTMDKADGRDGIEYFSADVSRWNAAKEMRLSEYDAATHAYRLTEHPIFPRDYENSIAFQGPMCVFGGEDGTSMLLAYEHGSQAPCKFLEFAVSPDRRASLRAVRGNYWDGREITPSSPYETIWFQAAVVKGGEDALAKSYRDFVLDRFTLNRGSRMPYIFYNTWASQERDKWWDHSGDFMNLMNEERILGDIDIAHELGVDVFVVDVSWFRQTGDWIVDENRFPHGLEAVSEKLKRYGMKMGLWFNPTEAAQNSEMMARNRKSVMSYDGVESPVHSVWQTPGSQNICVVSDYWKDFADRLIEIARKLDVTYFKWDGISQFGCNSPDHLHGDARTTGEDRHECYSFEQVRYLDKIVDRICDAIPGAIVDFDVTEGGRCVGLAFLASGKYFATNNGPYYNNLDIPFDWDNATTWCNVYVYPGPARAWVVRSSLDYDKWLPSVLFYAHYLPDGPVDSALINLGSMILGQNGVWGNLRAVSPGNLRIFGEALAEYKKVRDDITRASPVRIGRIGASPEIHEKIAGNGNGAVVIFANEGGEHVYVTEHKAAPVLWKSDTVDVSYDARGRAIVKLKLEYSWGAGIVIFGRDAGDFEVEKDGAKLKVEKARVSAQPINRRWPGHQRQLSQTGFSRFVRFDTDGPAKLEILAMRDFGDVAVKPLSKKTKVRKCGRRISLEIPGPGAYSVELDGCKDNLMVFADPPAEYGVEPGDPSVRYFGPGEHDAGLIEMKSGETVFIDYGAVVYGRIYAKDADGIRIVGRGILDASRVRETKIRDDPAKDREESEKGFAVCNVERFDTITLDFCDRVEIDGITIRDSLIYNIRPTGCRGVRINDVKTIGNWRYNSDGFDMHNCRDVVISGSFLRTYDDSVCVKGFDYRMDEADMLHDGEMFDVFENVLVTNCVIWCDWGRALEIGAETRAKEIRNVRFVDCDIIRSTHVALDVQNVDYADVHDIEFENIRVEIDGHTPRPAMQKSDDQAYFDDPDGGYMPTLFCSSVLYIPEYSKGDARRGNNRDIRLKDIFVTAPSMPPSVLSGFDAGHRTGAVSIDGLYLNGSRVGRDGANVSVCDFADEPDFVE